MHRRAAPARKPDLVPVRVVPIGEVGINDMCIDFPELPQFRFLVPLRTFPKGAARLTRLPHQPSAIYIAPHERVYFHSVTLLRRLVFGAHDVGQFMDIALAYNVMLARGLETLIRGRFDERGPEDVLAAHVVAARCGLPAEKELVLRMARARLDQTSDGLFFDCCIQESFEHAQLLAGAAAVAA